MKNLLNFFLCLLVVGSLKAQSTPWILQQDQTEFLQKLDSIFEKRFSKPMDLFPVFEDGAENFVRCKAQLANCSEDYVYNEAYLHEMATLPVPVTDLTIETLLMLVADAGTSPKFESYMRLLDPDKYWIAYFEFDGKYYLVACLGVDREKRYAEMGVEYEKE